MRNVRTAFRGALLPLIAGALLLLSSMSAAAARSPFRASPHGVNLGRVAEGDFSGITVTIANTSDSTDTPIVTQAPNWSSGGWTGSDSCSSHALAPGETCTVFIGFLNSGSVDAGRYSTWWSFQSTNTGAVLTLSIRATAL